MKSELLRKYLESKSIIKVGGAFDAMSAKLVESHGFDAIWVDCDTGYGGPSNVSHIVKKYENAGIAEIKKVLKDIEHLSQGGWINKPKGVC